MIENSNFSGDRPIEKSEDDKLGFKFAANHIASAIQHYSSPEGFVFGLEGAWGSGKSSFVNLIAAALKDIESAPEIVKFSPWIISSRDALLVELFREIAQAASKIDLIEVDSSNGSSRADERSENRANLKKKLHSYGNHLAKIGKIAGLANLFGVPYAELAEKGLSAVSEAVKTWSDEESIETEKEILKKELRNLSRKIVVFVDDLDRLEPVEAGEVVRLVRAVADFPNVVYVLCYSRPILAKSLSKAYALDDEGVGYIEKIVQATFSVPKPEDFDLRAMFREELLALFPSNRNSHNSPESISRLQALAEVIDYEGGRTLNTPRDVIRAINALRLYAGPVINEIDLADAVWLQLIRIRSTELFEWIESYINNVASIALGAHVTTQSKEYTLDKLTKILEKENGNNDERFRELKRMLPGIGLKKDSAAAQANKWDLYVDVNASSLATFVNNRRLGSPQHFRFYFSLSMPSSALADADFEKFILSSANSPSEAAEFFKQLANTPRRRGGVLAEAILERLLDTGIEQLPVAAIPGVIRSIGEGIDDAARLIGTGGWGEYWIWHTADRIFTGAWKRVPIVDRPNLLNKLFQSGRSLGWLTNILRAETFAHGRYGARAKPMEERLFTPNEFGSVVAIMLARYRTSDPKELLGSLNFSGLLYAWAQCEAGCDSEVRDWVYHQTEADNNLLEFLEKMKSWASVNDVTTYRLRTEIISHFMDVDAVRARLDRLSISTDERLRQQANSLLAIWVSE